MLLRHPEVMESRRSATGASDERNSVRCPVCRRSARIGVDIVAGRAGRVRRSATFHCPSGCRVSPQHALRLADPMAC